MTPHGVNFTMHIYQLNAEVNLELATDLHILKTTTSKDLTLITQKGEV